MGRFHQLEFSAGPLFILGMALLYNLYGIVEIMTSLNKLFTICTLSSVSQRTQQSVAVPQLLYLTTALLLRGTIAAYSLLWWLTLLSTDSTTPHFSDGWCSNSDATTSAATTWLCCLVWLLWLLITIFSSSQMVVDALKTRERELPENEAAFHPPLLSFPSSSLDMFNGRYMPHFFQPRYCVILQDDN